MINTIDDYACAAHLTEPFLIRYDVYTFNQSILLALPLELFQYTRIGFLSWRAAPSDAGRAADDSEGAATRTSAAHSRRHQEGS